MCQTVSHGVPNQLTIVQHGESLNPTSILVCIGGQINWTKVHHVRKEDADGETFYYLHLSPMHVLAQT